MHGNMCEDLVAHAVKGYKPITPAATILLRRPHQLIAFWIMIWPDKAPGIERKDWREPLPAMIAMAIF